MKLRCSVGGLLVVLLALSLGFTGCGGDDGGGGGGSVKGTWEYEITRSQMADEMVEEKGGLIDKKGAEEMLKQDGMPAKFVAIRVVFTDDTFTMYAADDDYKLQEVGNGTYTQSEDKKTVSMTSNGITETATVNGKSLIVTDVEEGGTITLKKK